MRGLGIALKVSSPAPSSELLRGSVGRKELRRLAAYSKVSLVGISLSLSVFFASFPRIIGAGRLIRELRADYAAVVGVIVPPSS